MKKALFVVVILLFSVSSGFAQEPKYRIDGKSYSKQIYDENKPRLSDKG